MDFDFISNTKFRSLLKRDFQELEVCLQAKAMKSVLVLTGSIIEAILVEYFLSNLPTGKTKEQILKEELFNLIDMAYKNKLISLRSRDLSTVIRNYRNLIHPGREVREDEKFDEDTAIVAFSLLKIISGEVKENYLKRYGYTSLDIISKLKTDSLSYSIFDQLIERLNTSERNKLLDELTEYELQGNDPIEQDIEDIKDLIQTLKGYVSKDVIYTQLVKLFTKVQTSQQWQIIKLYNLYHEDLGLMPQEDREIIVTYVLTFLQHHSEESEVRKFHSDRTFYTIGTYIDSVRLEEAFKNFVISYIVNYSFNSKYIGLGFYEQILNNLNPTFKDKIKNYVENEMPNFSKKAFMLDWNAVDDLPF